MFLPFWLSFRLRLRTGSALVGSLSAIAYATVFASLSHGTTGAKAAFIMALQQLCFWKRKYGEKTLYFFSSFDISWWGMAPAYYLLWIPFRCSWFALKLLWIMAWKTREHRFFGSKCPKVNSVRWRICPSQNASEASSKNPPRKWPKRLGSYPPKVWYATKRFLVETINFEVPCQTWGVNSSLKTNTVASLSVEKWMVGRRSLSGIWPISKR